VSVERSRALFLLALALAAAGLVLVLSSGPRWGGRTSIWVDDPAELTAAFDRPGLLVVGLVVALVAVVPFLVALVGALATAARAEQWLWFTLLLVLPGITLLVHVLVRPAWARSGAAPVTGRAVGRPA